MTGPDTDAIADLDSCAVSDALVAGGREGVATGLHAVATPQRVIGRVVTVQLGATDSTSGSRHLATAAVESTRPGEVIVVAGGRDDTAGWGGLLSRAAVARGVAAVVVDGAVRDVDECVELGLTVYARATTPRTARGRLMEVSWNQPVVVAGVKVRPGDIAVADGSGVVFVPGDIADDVFVLARTLAERERLMAARLDEGQPISTVMSADYEHMLNSKEARP